MATTTPNPSSQTQTSEFQLRRAALVSQISDSLESVLQQINALNRGLEGIIEIGNEFASVEALWSQFEIVMGPQGGKEDDEETEEENEGSRDGSGESSGLKKS